MNNKEVVIVTGASKGIGESISLKLANENYDVIIFGRDKIRLEKLSQNLKNLGSNSKFYSGDVADFKFVQQSVDDILKNYRRINAVINNAGFGIFKPFIDSTVEEFKQLIDTNLIGVYNFSKAVINHMIEKEDGTIINISSLAGKVGFQSGTMYSATKHAVMGFSKSLMQEVRKYNVRIVSVCPGSVNTEMISNTTISPKDVEKILQPEDVSEMVYAILNLPQRALVSEIEIRPNNP